ncbi:MAG: aminoacyl-tRNA hydrolase [Neisseriaceae bacterium]
MSIKLIVGLGNPGSEYAETRHNAGFWLVDSVANKYNVAFKNESKYFGEVAKFKYNNEDIFLLKPQTFMNLSGKAVAALALFYKILPDQILVAHDELDFNPNVVKLKYDGGNGGHNGLKDIDRVIGKNYWRLRLGIGHPGDKNKVVSYVLKKPTVDEKIEIDRSIDKSISFLELLLDGKFDDAMKKIHTA